MSSIAFESVAQQGAQRLVADASVPDAAVLHVAALATYAPQEARLTLAALLEASGVTDEEALSKGANDVFDLAAQQLATLAPVPAAPAGGRAAAPTAPARSWLPHLLIGPAQAAVMALAVAILSAIQVGLAGMGAQASTVTYGATAAAIVSGAALQISAWLIASALGRGQAHTLRRALRSGMLIGGGALVAVALGAAAASTLSGHAPRQALAFAAVLVLIGPLLLASGSLLILQRRAQVVLTLLLGAIGASVGAVALTSPVGQVFTTGGAALAATVALIVQAEQEVHRRGRDLDRRPAALPPAALVTQHVAPLACYGALTVALIFASQPQVWGVGQVLAEGRALSALHLAGLAVLVLAQGAFEVGMAGIWATAIRLQQQVSAAEAQRSGAGLWRFLSRTMVWALLLQLALAAFISLGCTLLLPPPLTLATGVSLALSLAGYSVLGHALFLCGVLNTLGYGWTVVQGLVMAGLTSGAAALLAATWLGPVMATAGVLAGGVVLLIVAAAALHDLLRDGDYALYRAF
jgi:hypothetical protein